MLLCFGSLRFRNIATSLNPSRQLPSIRTARTSATPQETSAACPRATISPSPLSSRGARDEPLSGASHGAASSQRQPLQAARCLLVLHRAQQPSPSRLSLPSASPGPYQTPHRNQRTPPYPILL